MANKITKFYKIGRNIAKYRKQKGLSQNQLAELLNVTREHLANIEIGAKMPTMGLFIKIAEVLNVPEKEFFNFDEI